MSTPYKPLFEMQCRHAYFGDGICHALRLNPTVQTKRLLDRYGCLFRSSIRGGTVLCPAVPSWRSLDELAPLSFALTGPMGEMDSCTDTGTATETTPTASPDTTVHSFHNLVDFGTETFDGRPFHLLHPPGNAFASSALPTRPSRFVHQFAEPLTSATMQVFDARQNLVWKLRTPDQPLAAVSVDLGDLAEGRYRLTVNGAGPCDFYLTGMAPAAVWGFVDIFPALLSGTGTAPAGFALSFAPRQSIWQYHLVSQSPLERTYENCRIALAPAKGQKTNGTAEVAFSAPVHETVNGQDAWLLESSAPIPLYEYPADHYQPVLKSNGKNAIAALPCANAKSTRLAKDANGNVRYCSEIFVYR